MRNVIGGVAAVMVVIVPALAQEVPSSVDDVARPGGDLSGDPQIALVKLAERIPTGRRRRVGRDGSAAHGHCHFGSPPSSFMRMHVRRRYRCRLRRSSQSP